MSKSGQAASTKTMEGPTDLPSLSRVIENIGMGPAQFRTGLLGGCVWLADGSELLLIGTVTRALSEEWQLEAWQRGAVVSIVFVGILLGNSLCGPFGDNFGRRLPVLVSYLGIAIFSVLSACTNSFFMLCAVRLLVGASFGIGQPAFSALCSEVTPSAWRIFMSAFCSALFILGELYSASLVWWDDPDMKSLDWRWLLLMGALPSAVLLVLAFFFLHQSPSYLAVQGEYEEAKKVLSSMRDDNGATDVSVEFRQTTNLSSRSLMEPVMLIFSGSMIFTTFAVIFSCFTLNVLFYGCLYAFPQVVTKVDMGSSPALSLIYGALYELPGNVIAALCGLRWPRKPVMLAYLALSCVALLSFVAGGKFQGTHWVGELLLQAGYCGIKCFSCMGFIVVYQYVTEIYPTVARTTGTAASIAGGRLGGIVSPMIFEWLLQYTGNFAVFFYMVTALCAVNFLLILLLPFETYGKELEDYIGEASPLAEQKANV